MNTYKGILLVRTDRMGDVVLTTPAIRAVRNAYPQAHIALLVSPATYDLVKNNPHLDEIIIDDRQNGNKGVRGFWRLVLTLRRKHFDLSIIFHTKKRTNLACFLAGIPVRLGYKDKKYGFLLNRPVWDTRHKGEKHEAQYCLDVLKPLGIISEDCRLEVISDGESDRWLNKRLAHLEIDDKRPMVAVHVGASDPSKVWPVENFCRLVNLIAEKYDCSIVLVGTHELRRAADMIKSCAHKPLIDMIGQTTVSQFISLLKRCNILISSDSGPVHLGAAMDAAVVSIFTRNQSGINPKRWRPLNPRSQVVSVPFDDTISFAKAGRVDPRKLQPIYPEEVLEAVDAIFKLC